MLVKNFIANITHLNLNLNQSYLQYTHTYIYMAFISMYQNDIRLSNPYRIRNPIRYINLNLAPKCEALSPACTYDSHLYEDIYMWMVHNNQCGYSR